MSDYKFKDTLFTEDEVKQRAQEKGSTLEEYLAKNPEVKTVEKGKTNGGVTGANATSKNGASNTGSGSGDGSSGSQVESEDPLTTLLKNSQKSPEDNFSESNIVSKDGWDYKKESGGYYVKKTGTEEWILSEGEAKRSVAFNIYDEGEPLIPKEDQFNIHDLTMDIYSRQDNNIAGVEERQRLIGEEVNNKQELLEQLELDYGTTNPDEIYADTYGRDLFMEKTGPEDVVLDMPENPSGFLLNNPEFWKNSNEREPSRELYINKRASNERIDFESRFTTPEEVNNTIVSQGDNYMSLEDMDIATLRRDGKIDEANKLAKDRGYVQLLNDSGETIGWGSPEDQDIEDNAQSKAESTDEDTLRDIRNDAFFKLITTAKLAHENSQPGTHPYLNTLGDVTVGKTLVHGVRNLLGDDSTISDIMPLLEEVYRTGNLPAGLHKLPSKTLTAKAFNSALDEFVTMNRALEINADLSLLPEENFFKEIIAPTNDAVVENFTNFMELNGFEVNPNKIKRAGGDWSWYPGAKEGGLTLFGEEWELRDALEAGRGIAKHLAPLAASVYITKKIPLGGKQQIAKLGEKGLKVGEKFWKTKSLGRVIDQKTNILSRYLKGVGPQSRVYKNAIDLTLGGIKETAMLAAADKPLAEVFGQDPFVYNPKTGDVHITFPFSLGFGNVAASKILNKLNTTKNFFTPALATISRSKTATAAWEAHVGATTGTATMFFAEEVTKGLDNFRNLGYESEEEMKQDHGFKNVVEAYIGMLMFQSVSPAMGQNALAKLGEGMHYDITRATTGLTPRAKKAMKLFGIDKNNKGEFNLAEIKNTKSQKIYEISKDKELSKEEKKQKIQDIENSAEELIFHNELKLAKKLAKNEGKYLDYLTSTFDIANKLKSGQKPTAKDIQRLSSLTDVEFQFLKLKLEVTENSDFSKMLDNKRVVYKDILNIVDRQRIHNVSPEARNKQIELYLEQAELSGEMQSLNKQSEVNPFLKSVNAEKILKIQEKLKLNAEKIVGNEELYDKILKDKFETEVKFAELMAKELGAGFEVLPETEYNKIEGSKEGAEGHYDRISNKVYINKERALEARQLGTPLHEITHAILRNSLKESYIDEDGNERTRVSKEGMIKIDQFLNQLNTKERALVEERMEKSYKYYRDSNGNFILRDGKKILRPKNEYAEEYLTAFGDVLKNKEVKETPDLTSRIAEFFNPILRRAGFKNMQVTTDDGVGLYNMIKAIQKGSETGVIDRGVLDIAKSGEKITGKSTQESRTDGFANETIAAELGLKSKTAEIVKENERLYDKVVENAKQKGIPVNKEAVTQRVKDALVMNNMARVTALAKRAAEAGERTGLEEGLRKGFEDFQSEYTMQLVELANTWNPARNKSFGAYMNGMLPLRYGNILKKLKGKSLEAKSLSDEATAKKAGAVEGGVKSSKEVLLETRSKFKKFILNRTEKSEKGLPKEQLTGKIKNAAQGALRTAGDVKAAVKNKPRLFLSNVEKSLENSLFKSFKNALGTRSTYKDVINNSFNIIQHTARTVRGRYHMNKAGMGFALKPVMNPKTGKQERMTTKEANDNGLPLNKDGSGPGKWEIDTKNFNEANYKSWANAEGMSGSAFGTRKDGLSRILSIETGKDAIPSQLKDPHQQVFDFDGKPIPGRFVNVLEGLSLQQKNKISAEALTAEVNNIIDRSPGLMFSITEAQVRKFEKLQENLDIGARIENLRKPENAEILKVYDKADINGDFIESLRKIEIDNFVKDPLMELREKEALVHGEEIKDRIDLNEIAVTNSQMKAVVKEFNERTKSNITYDKQDFARDPNKFKAYKKEIAETFEMLPEEFLNNDKVLNILINSIGQGNLNVGVRIKADGSKRKQVWLKPSGNESFMVTELGKKPTGVKEKVPTIKDINGKERSILDAVNITHSGKFKTNKARKEDAVGLKEFYEIHGKKSNYQQLLNKWANKKLAAKDFTWEQTDAANRYLRERFIEAAVKNVFNSKTPAEFQKRADAFHKLFQIQTTINSGMMKGTNTMRYITMEAPTKSPTGERMASGDSGYHAEHAFFNLAHNATVSNLLAKHSKSKDAKAFMEDYRKLSPKLQQFVITESHRQRNEGTQADGTILGNTEFFKGGNVDPMLNVLTRDPKKAWTTLDLKTGQTVGAGISKSLKLGGKEAQALTSVLGDVAFMFKNKQTGVKYEAKVDKLVSEANMFSKTEVKDAALKDKIEAMKIASKAFRLGRERNKKATGMSTFDFDETVGYSDNYVIAKKGGKTKRISSAEWPFLGDKMIKDGWEMDFSDFNKITDGKPGPLMQKMKNQIKKYGPENVFILTARAPESQKAIHDYLKSEGIEIPIENITGLGNSTGEAKAVWMLKKFAEGYNDMYFVDDALPNVKAVKKVLDQLDIKSKVQQVYSFTDINKEVNDIMKHSLDIAPEKTFSKAEAKVRGGKIRRRRIFMTDSAADLELLLEPLYGKGKEGIKNKKWFNENFMRPFERGYNDLNNAKQKAANGYMELRKQNKDVVKSLDKEVADTGFTNDMAMRVYVWNKNGVKIPDLAKATESKLVEHVRNNPKLQAFAENTARLTGLENGIKDPSNSWWAETLASEIGNLGEGVSRRKYLAEWIEAKNEIFSEENLNKMESKLGSDWRKNTEEMFERMETGRTRKADLGTAGNALMDYLNGSVGTIMSLNTRSATLQLISSVNFVNHSFNNPIQAARAFANQKQYWKDFMDIMNSDMLKQRRAGLQINVTEAELAAAASGQKNKGKAALAWILKQGYIPTKICDSFAIASGGATYYRNAIRKYMKEGLPEAEAKKKAWVDFQAIAERTQQSSRPDLLSAQQVSVGGRIILPFANTPMQMNRIMMKELLDIKNGRYKGFVGDGSITNKMSKIGYYGFVQSAIFAGLQSGLFALMLNSDDDTLKAEKKVYAANTMADSFLRGMGIGGAVLAGVKNAILEFQKQNDKGWGADYDEVTEDLLNISPTVGSKVGKLDAAGNTYHYNKKEILKDGLTLNGPALEGLTMGVEAIANIPVNRVYRKIGNIKAALDDQNEAWQRILVGLGWSKWDVGIGQREKAEEKVEKDAQKKIEKEQKKVEEKKAKEEEKKAEEQKKKDEGFKQVRCSGTKSNGQRCSITIETKAKTAKCTYHKAYKPNEGSDRNNNGIKEYQCKSLTGSGKRCKNRTENKNKKCYAHQ